MTEMIAINFWVDILFYDENKKDGINNKNLNSLYYEYQIIIITGTVGTIVRVGLRIYRGIF